MCEEKSRGSHKVATMLKSHRGARLAFVLCSFTLVAACSSSSTKSSPNATGTSASTLAPTTTGALTPAGRTWGVGRVNITLVDRSRPTAADPKNHVAARNGRTLPTVILYPTTTRSDDAATNGHPVAAGRFPLLVFSHGVTANGPAYVGVLKKVAAAGFIVALPTFPLTSGPHGWNNLTDVQNQPADVSFIIGQLLSQANAPKGLLAGHLDPKAIAVGGHSLGAITSLLFTNSCCVDPRVKAVVSISGMLFPAKDPKDNFDNPPTNLPILLLHGVPDKTVPYVAGSEHVFDTFTKVPRGFVTFPKMGHVDILGSPSLVPSIVAFLNLELRHDNTEWTQLSAALTKNQDATIQVAGGLPTPNP